MNFDEEMKPYYERYDRAFAENDIKELAYLAQFSKEPDIRKWWRRQICENMRNNQLWLNAGLTGVHLDDYGWHLWKIPGFEEQEFHPIGYCVNRGCCNLKEDFALGILQLPNGKWIASIGWDFTRIGHPYLYLGIHEKQFSTRTEAWNNAISEFVERWISPNKEVKKEEPAVVKAKSMIIIDSGSVTPVFKGCPVQLSLFDF